MCTNLGICGEVIDEFYIEGFKTKPFDYLYEFDIHVELTSMLKYKFKKRLFNIPSTTDEENSKFIDKYRNEKSYTISRVRTEYKSRIDIAILENDTIKVRPECHPGIYDKDEMFLYWQKVDIGIEIKFNYLYSNKYFVYMDDIQKLLELMKKPNLDNCDEIINTGISLLFFQKHKDFQTLENYYKDFREYKSGDKLYEKCVNAIVFTPEVIKFKEFK